MNTRRDRARAAHCRRSERHTLILRCLLAAVMFTVVPARAESPIAKHYLSAVVKLTAEVPPTARNSPSPVSWS